MKKGYKQTDVGLIPEDWDARKIGKLTNLSAGGTPSTKMQSYWNGDIPWMNSGELNLKQIFDVENRITEVGLKNSSTKFIPKFCVLIGLAGQGKTRGTAAFNHIELCTNQSIAAIYPSSQFDSTFLYYFIDSQYDELRKLSTGDGGRGGLNLTIIRNIILPLPPTLAEQKAIATALSDVDDLISSLDALIAKKKAIKQGAMQQLLTPPHKGGKRLDGFDGEWVEKEVSDVFSSVTDNRGKTPPYSKEDDIELIETASISFVSQSPDYSKVTKYVNKETYENWFRQHPKEGDILISTVGEYSGNSAIMTSNRGTIAQNLIGFRPKNINPFFFFYWTRSDSYRTQLKKVMMGHAQPSLKVSWLIHFLIQFPIDSAEQKAIAQILSDMDKELEELDTKKKKYEHIKQGMMQELLTGKTRLV